MNKTLKKLRFLKQSLPCFLQLSVLQALENLKSLFCPYRRAAAIQTIKCCFSPLGGYNFLLRCLTLSFSANPEMQQEPTCPCRTYSFSVAYWQESVYLFKECLFLLNFLWLGWSSLTWSYKSGPAWSISWWDEALHTRRSVGHCSARGDGEGGRGGEFGMKDEEDVNGSKGFVCRERRGEERLTVSIWAIKCD